MKSNTTKTETTNTNTKQKKYAGEIMLLPDELQELGYDVTYKSVKEKKISCLMPELISFKKNGKNVTIFDIPETLNHEGYVLTFTRIGNNTFRCNRFLKKVTIPSSFIEIGDNAFYNCSSLKSITIPDSIRVIGYNAFENCTLLKKVKIPNSVTTIKSNAFKNVPHIEYHGKATGAPWGAKKMN